MIRSFWYLYCYFKHISHIVLVFPLLLWKSKCQLVYKFVFKVYDKDSRTTTENFLLSLSLTLSRYFCTMKHLFLKCSLVCVHYGGGVHLRQMKLKRKILIRHCIKIPSCLHYTAQKMKFSIKDFVSKCVTWQISIWLLHKIFKSLALKNCLKVNKNFAWTIFFPVLSSKSYIFYKHTVLKNIVYHNPATFDQVFNKWSRHTERFQDVKKQLPGGPL